MALKLFYQRPSLYWKGINRFYSKSNKKFLDISKNDQTKIITVTMNRPPVNSLNSELLTELTDTFIDLEQEKPAGVILTSFSDKVYSAGLDINAVMNITRERLTPFWRNLQDTAMSIYGTSYPTVAVINGHAVAGGCMLALCCEYRIMLNNLRIGLNETNVGLGVPQWLITMMARSIGEGKAEIAVTTGAMFETKEALRIGLVDEIAADKADGIMKAHTFLKRFENVNYPARALTKKYVRGPIIEAAHKSREEEREDFISLITSPETQQHIHNYFATIKNKK